MVGRLLTYRVMPAISEFTERVVEGTRTPWLRSLQPALHPPGTALVRILTATQVQSLAVAVKPDGQRGDLGSRDKTLKVWEVASGRELRALPATLLSHWRWR